MKHRLSVATSCLLLMASAHCEEACVDADAVTQKAFAALAKDHAAQNMKVASDDVIVFRVLECGDNVEVVAFQRNRVVNFDFLFDRRTRKLLKAEAGDG